MTTIQRPHVDGDLPALLRLLRREFESGMAEASPGLIHAVGAARLKAPVTQVGALGLGGLEFAVWLVGQDPATPSERIGTLQAAFDAVFGPGPQSRGEHAREVAGRLIQGFGLKAGAAVLLDTLRAEFEVAARRHGDLPLAGPGLAARDLAWRRPRPAAPTSP